MDKSEMVERAIGLALRVHRGQKDKHGAAYILHPLRVGLRARNDLEMVAGILHDVVEDSDGGLTLDSLRNDGFPDEVVDIVDHLSKRVVDGVEESWPDYIARVMQHEAAMHLKLLDLEQNMDTTRISRFNSTDADRFTRYVEAWHAIREKLGLE
jgi:(p)ppGpp synthase/HD superfamily hydrolase